MAVVVAVAVAALDCPVLFNQRIRPDSDTQTDRDESSVRPFGCLAQLMISYEFCGKQDNAATAQRRAKRMPQQRDQHKDGKRSEDRKPQEFCIQFLGH